MLYLRKGRLHSTLAGSALLPGEDGRLADRAGHGAALDAQPPRDAARVVVVQARQRLHLLPGCKVLQADAARLVVARARLPAGPALRTTRVRSAHGAATHQRSWEQCRKRAW